MTGVAIYPYGFAIIMIFQLEGEAFYAKSPMKKIINIPPITKLMIAFLRVNMQRKDCRRKRDNNQRKEIFNSFAFSFCITSE